MARAPRIASTSASPPPRFGSGSPARQARLAAVVDACRRCWGTGIIRTAADLSLSPHASTRSLSTGSLGLDLLTNGLPRGGIATYAGPDSSGVDTLALTALARCQQAGGLALLVDAGDAADPAALAALGIDPERLLIVYPASAAQAWTVLRALCRTGALDLLTADYPALAALPGAEGGATRRGLAGLHTALRMLLHAMGPRLDAAGSIAALGAEAVVTHCRGQALAGTVPLEVLPRGGTHHALEVVTLGLHLGPVQSR